MKINREIDQAFTTWYEALPRHRYNLPAKGTLAGALVVLDHLQQTFDLDINAHTAKGGSQVRGASGTAVKKILSTFGETRLFVSEGGRTNRGLRGDIDLLLHTINAMRLSHQSAEARNAVLRRFQELLVDRVREFHTLKRLEIVYAATSSTWQLVHDLLLEAKKTDKDDAVSQYLVGAKLQLRFPGIKVENELFSTADVQKGRPGDFRVRDTVFHVTVRPTVSVYDKCRRNLEKGLRVYLLVPDAFTDGARQNAELNAAGQITVQSLESFVSQNIDELSEFGADRVKKELRKLFEVYNARVDSIEANKSLLIDIPDNL